MEEISNQDSINRREFLQQVATSTAIGLVGAGTVSEEVKARDQESSDELLAKAQQKYESPEKVQQALRRHGDELLQKLLEEDILTAANIEDLPVDSVLTPQEYIDRDEGTIVTAKAPNGTPSAHITISKVTENADVLITVFPQTGSSYAEIKTEEGAKLYDPDLESGSIDIEACKKGHECATCECGEYTCGCCTWELHCCDYNCAFGDMYSYGCDPCYDKCYHACSDLCGDDKDQC